MPRAGAIATCNGASGVPRAVRALRLAAARGLGECRAVQEGVDAGGGDRRRRPDVLTKQEVLGSARTTRTYAL